MRQRVDPFIPVVKPHKYPAGPYGTQYFRKPEQTPPQPISDVIKPPVLRPPVAPRRPRLFDDVMRQPRQRQEKPIPPVQERPVVPKELPHYPQPITKNRLTKTQGRWRQRLQLSLLIIVAAAVGLLIQSLVVGEVIIAVYAIVALKQRIASRTTFLLALIALVCIVVLVILQGDSTLSEDFAVYAFLLLGVATISLGLETRRHPA
jgi:hypothetical protein